MLTIYKYGVHQNIGVTFTLDLPDNCRFLTAQLQHNQLQLWVLLRTEAQTNPHKFVVYGTGWEIEESLNSLEYISTFQLENGALVFHLFAVKK